MTTTDPLSAGCESRDDGRIAAAFYRFVDLPGYASLRAPLLFVCERNDVRGTILLASEGVNGTIAGPPAGVRAVLDWLRDRPELADLEHKESPADTMPRAWTELERPATRPQW